MGVFMQTQDIRRQFLQYFKKQNHAIVSSAPVVPHDDPTLLFNNAGMNQFKDVFLGKSSRDYSRAATSQKCIRAGGKHNDLENVGHTTRHLTFFEMLGNFSFGDYFKEEAIRFAWEVATEVYQLEPEKIWPTVFRDDDEAFELWTKYVPADKITRFGEKENFWSMGDTGPCGPSSELLYDRGSKYSDAAKPSDDAHGERFLEFWNLVFMQYNRNSAAVFEPLPKPSIDTGAGLERVVSLKMGVESVFETDILRGIIAQIEHVAKIDYSTATPLQSPAFCVIADHLRCLSFAIADGVQPSNVDRGYVLRKVLRRAVRYGRILGIEQPFLADVLPRLIDTMGEDYPELQKAQGRISEILTVEEEAFFRTLRRGGNILNQIIDRSQHHGKKISGDDAFKLKDTYGLPYEEVVLLATDAGLTVDFDRYHTLEEEARERSRAVHKVVKQEASENLFAGYIQEKGISKFTGYSQTYGEGCIQAMIVNGEFVDELNAGDEGMVILNETPFYPEMGGQIGDRGTIEASGTLFKVVDCQAPYKGIIAHIGKLEYGSLHVGDTINATVNAARRKKVANNHTATHLLHWALHCILGEHIKQAGSVVDDHRLRFDFSHHKALSQKEIRDIEDLVNTKIRDNLDVKSYEISYEEAQKQTEIKQFFGDKYGSLVRVIDISFSKELCGGTHTHATGNIGYFRISKESSIAAGIRRIEAVSGEEAEQFARESEDLINTIAGGLKTLPSKLQERIDKMAEENKRLEQELKAAKKELLTGIVSSLLSNIKVINNIPLLTASLKLPIEDLKNCMDECVNKMPSGIVFLATVVDDKCHLLARVSDDFVTKGISAGDLIKATASLVDGSGGGKANSAQAGGKNPKNLPSVFMKVVELVQTKSS